MRKNILVFPSGSEVALEIDRSLRNNNHFNVIGASSLDDHGRFAFQNFIGGIPFHDEPQFISALKFLIAEHSIDAIYPAMDSVAVTLRSHEKTLDCIIIGSDDFVTETCSSKKETYNQAGQVVPCPLWWETIDQIRDYPVFVKPDKGYGSRDVCLANSRPAAEEFVAARGGESRFLYCEYLPGDEYTIDCFSDQYGSLRFHGARRRSRIANGISVRTERARKHLSFFEQAALALNNALKPRGAWFFQMKENAVGEPVLLEVAARLSGSSALFRASGVNLALLSVFDAFGVPVSVQENRYPIVLDRALANRYLLGLEYDTVYVDLDDCALVSEHVNVELISFLFQAVNAGKRIILLTRHRGEVSNTLRRFRISELFDEVIRVPDGAAKSDFCRNERAIFIDDSFSERRDVFERCGIPVFSTDMVEVLLVR